MPSKVLHPLRPPSPFLGNAALADPFQLTHEEIEMLTSSTRKRHQLIVRNAMEVVHQRVEDFEALERQVYDQWHEEYPEELLAQPSAQYLPDVERRGSNGSSAYCPSSPSPEQQSGASSGPPKDQHHPSEGYRGYRPRVSFNPPAFATNSATESDADGNGAHDFQDPEQTMFEFDFIKDNAWPDLNMEEPSFLIPNNASFCMDLSHDDIVIPPALPPSAPSTDPPSRPATAPALPTPLWDSPRSSSTHPDSTYGELSEEPTVLSSSSTSVSTPASLIAKFGNAPSAEREGTPKQRLGLPPGTGDGYSTALVGSVVPANASMERKPAGPSEDAGSPLLTLTSIVSPPATSPPESSPLVVSDPATSRSMEVYDVHQRLPPQNASSMTLTKEKRLLERDKVALDREKLEFRKEKKAFEEWRLHEATVLDAERKKVKRDRVLVDKNRKSSGVPPSRRERQEIEDLKRQVSDLQAQLKARESKAKLMEDRLQKRIDELQADNKELRDELHVLEGERANVAVTSLPSNGVSSVGPFIATSSTSSQLGTPSLPAPSTGLPTPAAKSGLPLSPRVLRISSPLSSHATGRIAKSTGSTSSTHSGGSVSMHRPRMTAPSVLSSQSSRDHLEIKDNATVISALSQGSAVAGAEPPKHWRHYFDTVEQISHLGPPVTEKSHRDGIRERRYANGTRVVLYKNGTTKEYRIDGCEITRYTNNDVKEVFPDRKFVYYFSDKDVTQTTFADGMTLTEFADGQTEKKYPDGMTEIVFPNQSIRYIYPSGEKEDIFPDGTMEKTDSKGNKTVIHSDGSKEIWSKDKKKRIMPNGEVKVVFSDGTRQKILPDGRMRIIDALGNIIKDEIGSEG